MTLSCRRPDHTRPHVLVLIFELHSFTDRYQIPSNILVIFSGCQIDDRASVKNFKKKLLRLPRHSFPIDVLLNSIQFPGLFKIFKFLSASIICVNSFFFSYSCSSRWVQSTREKIKLSLLIHRSLIFAVIGRGHQPFFDMIFCFWETNLSVELFGSWGELIGIIFANSSKGDFYMGYLIFRTICRTILMLDPPRFWSKKLNWLVLTSLQFFFFFSEFHWD